MTDQNATESLKTASELLQQAITGVANLVEQSTQLGLDLLDTFTGSLSSMSAPSINLSSMKMPQAGCGCKIPPPCWIPRSAGHVISHVCPGASATLRVSVTNCGPGQRVISFDDAGRKIVSFQPGTLTLGPMETGHVDATLAAASGEKSEEPALVWIRGCKEHYLRWTVKIVKRGVSCSCHEVSIEDCPDYVHHWYDHFYCPRPCPSPWPTQGRNR